jgi:hypothetical protein
MCGRQVVDENTQKAMMAWYFKKQEEQKVCRHFCLIAFQGDLLQKSNLAYCMFVWRFPALLRLL